MSCRATHDQFTCFTGTKVQILTLKARTNAREPAEINGSAARTKPGQGGTVQGDVRGKEQSGSLLHVCCPGSEGPLLGLYGTRQGEKEKRSIICSKKKILKKSCAMIIVKSVVFVALIILLILKICGICGINKTD